MEEVVGLNPTRPIEMPGGTDLEQVSYAAYEESLAYDDADTAESDVEFQSLAQLSEERARESWQTSDGHAGLELAELAAAARRLPRW